MPIPFDSVGPTVKLTNLQFAKVGTWVKSDGTPVLPSVGPYATLTNTVVAQAMVIVDSDGLPIV